MVNGVPEDDYTLSLVLMIQMNQECVGISAYFADPLLLSYITGYLSIRERLALTTLSKKIRFLMEQHFRMLLHDNRLHTIPHKSAIHQTRFYFDRCLRLFRAEGVQGGNQPQGGQPLLTTLENPFKFKVITFFEVGMLYSCFLDNQQRAFIFRTNQLLSLIESHQKPIHTIQPGVKEVRCKGEKLFLLRLGGEVSTWETDKKSMDLCQKRSDLHWSLHLPVKSMHVSFNYAVFILQNPHQSKQLLFKHLFNYSCNIDIAFDQSEENKYHLIALNIQTNAYFIVSVRAKSLVSIAVGHKEAYLVNEHHECMIVQFEQVNEGVKELSARGFHPLAEKQVVKVFGNYNFFVAIERNVEVIEEWSVEQVAVWLRDIGFGDFIKIARAERVDGRRLRAMERKYMEKVLGISKLNMQQKLLLCIEEAVEGRNERDQVWVWGKNDHGQLGLSHANYVAQPIRLKLDFLSAADRIDSVFCGWFQTFIRTHRGKIYHSTVTTERKKKKPQEEKQMRFSDEEGEEEVKGDKEGKEEAFRYKNKRRKKTEDFQQPLPEKKNKNHHKRYEEEAKWVQSQAGKAFFVESFKDYVFYIQCPEQNRFEPTKQKKLRTSKAIIDRILWDDSLNKTDFKIGLIDKDMGTIEVSLFQIQAFEYKETSIRYVKRDSTVVWDRESKIDHL